MARTVNHLKNSLAKLDKAFDLLNEVSDHLESLNYQEQYKSEKSNTKPKAKNKK